MRSDHNLSVPSPPQPTAGSGANELLPPFLHDLNNLLGIVLGNAELLMDPTCVGPKREKRAESIYRAALNLKELVVGLQNKLP